MFFLSSRAEGGGELPLLSHFQGSFKHVALRENKGVRLLEI